MTFDDLPHDQQVEILNNTIAKNQADIDLHSAVTRLSKNADFKLLIEDHYFGSFASGLVMELATPAAQGDADQATILDSIKAVGHFRQFLSGTAQLGMQAAKANEDSHSLLDSINGLGE